MADKKSITLVSNNYWTLYKFRYDVIKLFLSKGFHVNLIAVKDSYSNKFDDKDMTKYYISMNNRGLSIIGEIKTFVELFKIYKKINSDLTFHFTIKPNLYGSMICRLLDLKSISFITGIGHTFIYNNFLQKFIIFLYKISLTSVKEIWFTNQTDKQLFDRLNIIKKNKTRIIPGAGINIPENEPIYKYSSKKLFLMISRLQKEKGVLEYLSCAEKFKNNSDINFMLIGDGNSSDPSSIDMSLINQYIQNNSIIYKKYQQNISKFINMSSCIVLPSYREGMSTVLLEASIMKRPIITTNVPGCIDIIKDESYGVLCEARSKKSLLCGINKLLKLDKDKISLMVEKTFLHVKHSFSKNIVLAEYKNSLNHIK
tara:strand:+ start:2700 stop:3809 length:1110 start_codon:yes stop_codon:yes gene_type:complete